MTDEGVIIILSEDDSDGDEYGEPSVLIVEEKEVKKPAQDMLPANIVDEDLVITYSQRAEVLPHARYDCSIHPFTVVDCETAAPVGSNHLLCDQCFCYICDKLASKCSMWHQKGLCHCNSHKRSAFWISLRNSVVLGNLESFKLSILDMDSYLRNAEVMLQSFRSDLAVELSKFLLGVAMGSSNQPANVYDYTPVYTCVCSFLDMADNQEDRAAALMRLGAAQDITGHFQPSGFVIKHSTVANICEAKDLLMRRIVDSVQRQMVMAHFSPQFSRKLQDFFQRLNLPYRMKSMRSSMCVRPWTDVLLVSVLKGQNVTGMRQYKGKKEVLLEDISVVLLRMELLQQQHRYRELVRYLRAVQTTAQQQNSLREVQDLVPLFLCMAGDFSSAHSAFFTSHTGIASRLLPFQFILYLRIFETATAPVVTIGQPLQLDCTGAIWEPINGAVPLNRVDLVKFALRVQSSSEAVYKSSECWAYLLTRINVDHNSHKPLPEPSHAFLCDARIPVKAVIENQMEMGSRVSLTIPLHLLSIYPDQSLLLLVTEALALRIISAPLIPVLPVFRTFKESSWAFDWLHERLSTSPDVFAFLNQAITQEMGSKVPGIPQKMGEVAECIRGSQPFLTHGTTSKTGSGTSPGRPVWSCASFSPEMSNPHWNCEV